MNIKELKDILKDVPEEQDNLMVTAYGQGVIGYADIVENAYVGKTYVKKNGCRKTLQLQFNPGDNVKQTSTIHFEINRILCSLQDKEYYGENYDPVPKFSTIVDALEYLHKRLCNNKSNDEMKR